MSALLKKWTGEKNAIISLNVKVRVTLPTDLDSRAMPNETSLAATERNKEVSRHVVYAVGQALPPPDHPVCIDVDVMRKIGAHVGMKIKEIEGTWPGVREDAKVVADRKQDRQPADCGKSARAGVLAGSTNCSAANYLSYPSIAFPLPR